MRRAVFLDRDGVLIEDVGLITEADRAVPLPGVAAALSALHARGFALIAVSNQTVIARGLASEEEVALLDRQIDDLLAGAGAPRLNAFYFCPHHPRATIASYRRECECRKPRPGMLLRAAEEHGLALEASFLVGDRLSDIAAGSRAGCRTILVTTGRHDDPPIASPDPVDGVVPDHTCTSLAEAARWILGR